MGHHKMESPLNMRNLQGRLCMYLARVPGRPRPNISKLGIYPDDGTLKILAGIPFRPSVRAVRPFGSEDGGMMRERTRDPENGQS